MRLIMSFLLIWGLCSFAVIANGGIHEYHFDDNGKTVDILVDIVYKDGATGGGCTYFGFKIPNKDIENLPETSNLSFSDLVPGVTDEEPESAVSGISFSDLVPGVTDEEPESAKPSNLFGDFLRRK